MKEMKVSKINNGTVIDHIPPGRALEVLKLLGITGKEGKMILVAMNVTSNRMKGGRKDIVKIEGLYLSEDQIRRIALIAPTATINIIKNREVVEKKGVEIPDEVSGILKCSNPTCITRNEKVRVASKFRVINKNPLRLQCVYCESIIEEEEISKYMVT
ncbi:aspartate carbamoyltransferase [Ignicoccus islandicus DSM 13165]|uniref:Aspartate carbamoyltransferase regulatory chain n=1 Tax=Ignicoccus islandicus DSM 13165 TaxID=940295 RepID=A0A0U2WLB8_9CREN|nr:aspartate carbamoyltransferase regulatory subunit [Ignicoccus islandicus]ALU11729.1 aspartate carbamoyltransferase [Ignicoccus islandicus DSM 13165]